MCAVSGHPDAANLVYLGLYALQHRGQESAGIAAFDGQELRHHKAMGYVADIFDRETLDRLPGHVAVGHVRYSTAGNSSLVNAQPVVANTHRGRVALAHNGNLVNALLLRRELESDGRDLPLLLGLARSSCTCWRGRGRPASRERCSRRWMPGSAPTPWR